MFYCIFVFFVVVLLCWAHLGFVGLSLTYTCTYSYLRTCVRVLEVISRKLFPAVVHSVCTRVRTRVLQ